jgi:bifunctional non-homologous end joining protein LigD
MLARRRQVRLFAFDLLRLNREDLRGLPLVQRKAKLKKLLPSRSPHILYVDHTKGSGTELLQLICQLDLEGIVAKKADSIYDDEPKSRHWIKIKHPDDSQKEGRSDLLTRTA